jgi:cold shock CspA family protein
MVKGKIEFFNDDEGYGIIIDENGNEIYFELSDFQENGETDEDTETIEEGVKVEFEIEADEEETRAIQVRPFKENGE